MQNWELSKDGKPLGGGDMFREIRVCNYVRDNFTAITIQMAVVEILGVLLCMVAEVVWRNVLYYGN